MPVFKALLHTAEFMHACALHNSSVPQQVCVPDPTVKIRVFVAAWTLGDVGYKTVDTMQ